MDTQHLPAPPETSSAPVPTKRRRSWVWTALIALAALFIGAGIGVAGSDTREGDTTDEGELAAAQRQLTAAQDQLSGMQDRAEDAERLAETYGSQLETVRAQRDELQDVADDRETLAEEIADLREKNANLREQIVKLKKQVPTGPRSSFGDGTYRVGEEIAPGTYRSSGGGGSCYWERLRNFSGDFGGIITNYLGQSPTIVTIASSDAGFHSERCGTWRRI